MSQMGFLWNPVTEAMDRERLTARQEELLRFQVPHLFQNSRFYREKWERAAVGPSDIRTMQDLDRLPVTTYADLEAGTAPGVDPFGGRLSVPESGLEFVLVPPDPGLPDRPVFTGLTPGDRANLVEAFARYSAMLGMGAGDTVQVLSWGQEPLNMAYFTGLGGVGTYGGPTVADLLGIHVMGLEISPAEAVRTVNTAKLLRPRALWANMQHLEAMTHVLQQANEEPLSLGYELIVVRERSLAIDTRPITGLWGAEVYRLLECPEAQFYAMECPAKTGLHVWEDHYLVEATDPDGRSVPVGSSGRLTITTLTLAATPLIRYQTSVAVRIDRAICSCGRTHARLLPGKEG